MKLRIGFVSNSSSSSFIIRKSALEVDEENTLLKLFLAHNHQYETCIEITPKTYEGRLEAHNALNDYDAPLATLVDDLMHKWEIAPIYDYAIEYEDYCNLEER